MLPVLGVARISSFAVLLVAVLVVLTVRIAPSREAAGEGHKAGAYSDISMGLQGLPDISMGLQGLPAGEEQTDARTYNTASRE